MEPSGGRSRSGHGPKLHIHQSDLMCKTGCGFFGNIAWQGYCSKCYKEYFLQRQQHQAAFSPSPASSRDRKVARSQSDASTYFAKPDSASASLPRHGFSRFEEKKRHNQEIRTTAVKSLFRKTPNKFGSPKSKDRRALSPESHSAIVDLDLFLQTLPQNAAHHAYSFLKVQAEKLDRLVSSGVLSPLDISDRVHSIYQVFDDKLKTHSGFSEMNSNSMESLLDQSERYLTRLLYRKLFCPPNCDDEERDLTIQKRIRSLNWISAPLLDCRINELDSKVRDILEKAITHLIEMDGQRAPQDKLTSIINCSKLVFEMLGLSNSSNVDQLRDKTEKSDEASESRDGEDDQDEAKNKEPVNICNYQPVSADDFLPALIYVVLRANPPRIHSNLNFITRFAAPGRLLQGEGGYYFTNLCCAVSFLENLTSDSLGLSTDEFDRYMSGKSIPFASLQAGVMVSEGLRLMYQNMSTLSELKHKQIHLQQQILELKNDMETFNEFMTKEVTQGLEQFPIQIRGKRAPIKPDEVQPDENDTLKLLPPPLLPFKISESPLPPIVDSVVENLEEHLMPTTSIGQSSQAPKSRQTVNLLDGSIQELDLFALNELSINSSVTEQNDVEEDDPFSSLSLTVQGRERPSSLLSRGWLAVIFSTLKKNPAGSGDKLKLFKSLDSCLKVMNVDPTDPSSWNLNDQYDSLINDLMQSMLIQDSPEVTKCNLEILVILFQSMQIKMAKFLPLIISALDTHITEGVTSDILLLSIKVVEHIIEYCWTCLEPQFTNQLTWILFKLGSEREREEVVHFDISKCKDLLKQISFHEIF
nr:EOG090X03G5 [Simocephalus serrulatus]